MRSEYDGTVQFYNGREMPKVDLGTYRVENSDQCKDAVKHAIEMVIEV